MISVLWPLPLPIAPSRLCPSLFTAVAHRPCPFLWVPVFYMWRSKNLDRSMGGELWGREHGTWGKECGDGTVKQFFSGCVLSKIFVYGDGKMMLWFCGCILSKNVITWFAHHCCLSPLPVAFALRLCQSMLPVAIRCCCSFLSVLVFYIWWSKHFYRSMGRETWGRKHWTDNDAFFLLVFCQKNIYWEWTLFVKRIFIQMGQWGIFFWLYFVWNFSMEMEQCGIFFLLSFVDMGMGALRWDSVAIYF